MTDHQDYTYPGELLKDRIILITGASDGIGRALAVHAAGHGAQVILHGRNVSKLEKVYDQIEALRGAPRPSIAVMDLAVAGSDAYTSLADSLSAEFGRLDGLVNNASILGERYSIEQYDAAMWQQVMHINVTAAFAITQVCLPLLHQSADASIIFTSSGVGRVGKPFWGAYAVSKFATEGLSQVLASEQEHGAIRVNCINPGAVRTEMRRAAYPAEDRDVLKTAEEILPTYMYLLGPDSQGVTGQSLDAQ
ncbi:MAG: YciK family oxidoreductase [Gammaproteobacteria bacterium]|jgi:NAD(P)-dependent dehydrogenase (short-subunit alcohol dehydrogenase family)|nr:YciK family oxidoreductase [Gammaproteobacteria bacterium]MDH3908569.1 YciK family oxidoreductase [Gammaproteobacteria bacterium]MDH3953576.1 YciK family oxidoreductase [Gammaproteobacteria bacterium]MDH4006047.1 YciK family oxidoreductase [Gammaproteobacteria bacterium]NCF59653.1 YciK family oxidoreductase [Gammaproteobacteria bacterium]